MKQVITQILSEYNQLEEELDALVGNKRGRFINDILRGMLPSREEVTRRLGEETQEEVISKLFSLCEEFNSKAKSLISALVEKFNAQPALPIDCFDRTDWLRFLHLLECFLPSPTTSSYEQLERVSPEDYRVLVDILCALREPLSGEKDFHDALRKLFFHRNISISHKALRCELAEGIFGKDENYETQLRYLAFSSCLSDADLLQIAALILKDDNLFDRYLSQFPYSNVQDRWFIAILICGFADIWDKIPEEKEQVIIEAAQRLFKDESFPCLRQRFRFWAYCLS